MVLNIFLYLLISSNTRTGLRTARGRGKTPIPPAGRRRETATPREESPDRNDGQRDVASPEAARAIQPRAPALAPGIPPASDSHFPTALPRRAESLVPGSCPIRRPTGSISSTAWGVRFICFEYFPSLSGGGGGGAILGAPVMIRCRCRCHRPSPTAEVDLRLPVKVEGKAMTL